MGTSSCDSADECVIRGCQFSKHSNGEINHGQAEQDTKNESNSAFADSVNSKLSAFFLNNLAAKKETINSLKTIITGKNTEDMDIDSGCIGLDNVFKKEGFTHDNSTSSVIACVIIGIIFTVAAIFIWRWFIDRRNKPLTVDSTTRPIDRDKEFTIKRA